jgi:hypothetical protein
VWLDVAVRPVETRGYDKGNIRGEVTWTQHWKSGVDLAVPALSSEDEFKRSNKDRATGNTYKRTARMGRRISRSGKHAH